MTPPNENVYLDLALNLNQCVPAAAFVTGGIETTALNVADGLLINKQFGALKPFDANMLTVPLFPTINQQGTVVPSKFCVNVATASHNVVNPTTEDHSLVSDAEQTLLTHT